MQERYDFLKALQEAHEEDKHAYQTAYCIKLFEELTALWCEQVRESRRTLCAQLGTENPQMEDLRLLALSPFWRWAQLSRGERPPVADPKTGAAPRAY